jgi:hypothetical protein
LEEGSIIITESASYHSLWAKYQTLLLKKTGCHWFVGTEKYSFSQKQTRIKFLKCVLNFRYDTKHMSWINGFVKGGISHSTQFLLLSQ